MINLSYEEIVQKLKEKSDLSVEEIKNKITKKLDSLSNLISKEGAAHIIANELGVKLFDDYVNKKRFKVNQLKLGLKNAELLVKVVNIYETKTFEKNGRQGRVASLLVGDETGVTRLVVWDEKLIDQVSKLKQDDIIIAGNTYIKENNGYTEAHLGAYSQIEINPEGQSLEVKQKIQVQQSKAIKDLSKNEIGIIQGTVIQVFEPKFYTGCPQCYKKLVDQKCVEHGEVEAYQVPILNFFVDDGTESIRVVCFRETAEGLLNKTNLHEVAPEEFEIIKNELLGEQVQIKGRVSENAMTNRLELVAFNVDKLNPKDILQEKELVEEIKIQ